MKKIKEIFTYAFATTFGLGFLPASGTFGSLFPLALYIFIPNKSILWAIFIFHTLISVPVSRHASQLLKKKDPSEVVIDEVVGQFMPLLFLCPEQPALIYLSFILFRIFDALKIPPVDYFENFPNGWGIVLDDVMAGAYTTLCIWILQLIF